MSHGPRPLTPPSPYDGDTSPEDRGGEEPKTIETNRRSPRHQRYKPPVYILPAAPGGVLALQGTFSVGLPGL